MFLDAMAIKQRFQKRSSNKIGVEIENIGGQNIAIIKKRSQQM